MSGSGIGARQSFSNPMSGIRSTACCFAKACQLTTSALRLKQHASNPAWPHRRALSFSPTSGCSRRSTAHLSSTLRSGGCSSKAGCEHQHPQRHPYQCCSWPSDALRKTKRVSNSFVRVGNLTACHHRASNAIRLQQCGQFADHTGRKIRPLKRQCRVDLNKTRPD